MNKTKLEKILNLLQDAEARSFYAYADEPNKFRKGWGKVLNQKIREAVEAAADIMRRVDGNTDAE